MWQSINILTILQVTHMDVTLIHTNIRIIIYYICRYMYVYTYICSFNYSYLYTAPSPTPLLRLQRESCQHDYFVRFDSRFVKLFRLHARHICLLCDEFACSTHILYYIYVDMHEYAIFIAFHRKYFPAQY